MHSHPDIICHHEIFNPRGIFLDHDYDINELELGSLQQRNENPKLFLERLWKCFLTKSCVGFKMTREQKEITLKIISNNQDLKVILLSRKNRIKTYVSELIAEELDQWEVYIHDELIKNRPKVTIHASGLKSHAGKNNDFMHEIKQELNRTHSVYLETAFEHLMDPVEHKRILDFLEVSNEVILTPSSVKQNIPDLRHLISNYSDLEKELTGTDFQNELY